MKHDIYIRAAVPSLRVAISLRLAILDLEMLMQSMAPHLPEEVELRGLIGGMQAQLDSALAAMNYESTAQQQDGLLSYEDWAGRIAANMKRYQDGCTALIAARKN